MHAVLIHGWKGWPENAWFPWLREELETRGWTTEAPAMPNPILPRRERWVSVVLSKIKQPETVLIGHSLGCLAILWALAEYTGSPPARTVLVSGFGRPFLRILKNSQYHQEWFPRELDFSSVKSKSASWAVIHGRNDRLVPFEEGEWLAAQLGVALVVPKRTGHLIHEEGALDVPEILDAVTDGLQPPGLTEVKNLE